MRKYFVIAGLFLLPLLLVSSKPERKYYNELYRPQFHFSPEKNWQNDPNGLVYYNGEYHLFYQYNPKDTVWGYMHWGHAISTDLVHWQHLPVAIYPDNNSEDVRECTAYSGSAIVDANNVLKLQKGKEKTLVAFYTSYHCGQRIAYSNDKGRTWEKYAGNPVIPFDEKDDARDPKVFWHQPSGKWVMVLWRKLDGDTKKQGISIYNSTDLVHWEYKSHVPGLFECPDLVELKINNRPNEKAWVIFGGDGSYLIGSFDGEMFKPESAKMLSDYGNNYYASQTWSNIPVSDGRVIQIAWMKGGEYPEMAFKGQMTFPCELSLRDNGFGKRLVRTPVKEIESLHDKGQSWTKRNVIPGINDNILHKFRGDCFHITGTFDLKTSDNFGFIIRNSKKTPGTEILYSVKRGVLSCMGKEVPLPPIDGKIQIEILLDRSSVEIFANKGIAVMTSCLFEPEDNLDLELFTIGGELMVDKLDIYPVKTVWRDKDKD